MISASPQPDLNDLLDAITEQAAALAEAAVAQAQLEPSLDPLRWRDASLLWPLATGRANRKG